MPPKRFPFERKRLARTVTTEATDGVVAGGGERNARTLLLLCHCMMVRGGWGEGAVERERKRE